MGRQFIAVVPQGLNENRELNQLMSKLKRTMDQRQQQVRWVQSSLWHVTLHFLGDQKDNGRAKDELHQVLQDWHPQVANIKLRLHGLGAFPSSEEARVLWIGVQESQEFISLQKHLAQHLTRAGYEVSAREFNPHLTLARFRNTMNATDLIGLGGRKHFGDYNLSEVVLFESVLQGNILKYSPQMRKSLRNEINDSDSVPLK